MLNDDQEAEWRNKLVPGDEVYISQSYGAAPIIGRVSRLTATRIMVKTGGSLNPDYEMQFHKRNGWTVGRDSYNRQHLIVPSEKIRERVELEHLKRRAIKLKDALSIPQEKEGLRSFIKALSKFVKK